MKQLLRSTLLKTNYINGRISFKKFCDKPQSAEVKQSAIGNTDQLLSRNVHVPTKFEKFALVCSGRYKSMAEVPRIVTFQAIEKSKSKCRVKIAYCLAVATVIASFCVAWSGRRAAERGESLSKMNEEWHRKINEEYKKGKT